MKDIVKFGLMTVLALTAVSCAKENISDPADERDLVEMTFKASIDQTAQKPVPSNAATRTYLDTDGKTVKWHEDDVIGIHDGFTTKANTAYNQQFAVETINVDGSAVFKGAASAGQEVYYASYPYDAANFITSEGKMRIAFLSNQTASSPGTFDRRFNSSAAMLKDGVFSFKNLGGLLKFTLAADNVKKVTLTANDGGTVGGVYYIYFDENGDIDEEKTTLASGRASMYLTPSGAETFEPGTYYFVLSARTFTGGVTISFLLDDGSSKTASTDQNVIVKRSKITNIGTFDTTVSSDDFTPVSFPVVFPMGYPDDATAKEDGYNYPAVANTWVYNGWYSSAACSPNKITGSGQYGILYSKEQPQAQMQWNWGDAIAALSAPHFIETANTYSNSNGTWYISTVGIKGVWTGDFFEFILPVANFKAATTLRLKMPILSTYGPVFWEVLYLDGEEWKSTATADLPAYEGSDVTRTATWAIPYSVYSGSVNTLQTVDMTFADAITKGEVRIKVRCVDGSVVATGANAVSTTYTKPRTAANGTCSANFYFYNPADRNNSHITIDIVE